MFTFTEFLAESRHRTWSIPRARLKRNWKWSYARIADYFGVAPSTVWQGLHSKEAAPQRKVIKKDKYWLSKKHFQEYFPEAEVYTDYQRDPYHGDAYSYLSVDSRGMCLNTEYSKKRKSLYIGIVEAADNPRGHKNAKKMMRSIYEMAKGFNAKKIELEAGLESGGYVWAKLGFQLQYPRDFSSSWELSGRLYYAKEVLPTRVYNKLRSIIKEGGRDMNVKLAKLKYPLTKSQFRHIMGEGTGRKLHNPTLGKAMLLGTSYEAFLPPERYGNLLKWARKLDKKRNLREEEKKEELVDITDILFDIIDQENEEEEEDEEEEDEEEDGTSIRI